MVNINTSPKLSMAQAAEDNALVSVPMDQRRSGHYLAINTVGVATALVIFAISGFAVILAGFWMGLLAGAAVGVMGFLLSYLLGQIAWTTGVSSTVSSRFFGLGLKGSSIGSAIFAFMILGFLALESALLYEGTILMFGWDDTMTTRIVIYGVLTVAWILLAIFGLQLLVRASLLLIILTVAVTLYLLYEIYLTRGAGFAEVVSSQGVVPGGGWPKFEAAFALMGATGGTIALLTTDFARYCRTKKDVAILSMAGPITQNIIMLVLGSLVVVGGLPAVTGYLMERNAGMSPAEAAAAAGGFAMGNTGAFFVVLAGWMGLITIYATQAKAQGVNAYAGSLALVNFADALFGRKPGRALMVVVGNVISLIMIGAGILGHFSEWLAYLGCMALALVGVIVADFYLVRKRQYDASSHRVEEWNWAGVVSLAAAAVLGILLIATDITSLGFMLSLATALVLYPVLRKMMPAGTGTKLVSSSEALEEAA